VALAAQGLAVWVGLAKGVASALGAVDRVTVANGGSSLRAMLIPTASLPWAKHIAPIATAAATPIAADMVLTLPLKRRIVFAPIVFSDRTYGLPTCGKTVYSDG
jgi:hypothetical protein